VKLGRQLNTNQQEEHPEAGQRNDGWSASGSGKIRTNGLGGKDPGS